jgi:hypothetical protein
MRAAAAAAAAHLLLRAAGHHHVAAGHLVRPCLKEQRHVNDLHTFTQLRFIFTEAT